GIVTVYDVTVWEGTPILVMELVTGTPLSRFRQGDLAVERVMDLAAQTAAALSAAHARGIVHGDLKPENIMAREDWYVKVLDFGSAGGLELTHPGHALEGACATAVSCGSCRPASRDFSQANWFTLAMACRSCGCSCCHDCHGLVFICPAGLDAICKSANSTA